jgi:hypothetical protein
LPDRGLKGEKLVFTAVMYLVSITAGVSEILGSALGMPSRPAVYVLHSRVVSSVSQYCSRRRRSSAESSEEPRQL